MLHALLDRLFGPYKTPLAELDMRHAMAGLLVRLAKADADYTALEIARIDRVLAASYGLDPVAAAKLRAEAEKLAAAAPPDGRFAETVRERTDPEAREAVLAAMWQVVLADGAENAREHAYLMLTAERLGLDAAAVARAEAAARQATG